MFGFIKNLFGGIFGFIGKVLGLKKSGYALEFEPAQGEKSAPAKQDTSAQKKIVATATGKVKEPAKPAATKAESAKKPEPVKAQTQAPAKESKPAAKAPAPKAEPAKSPEPVGGFATRYLTPTATSTRRRPGANMSSFLDMARQVNTAR
ncbi:hypothetical protein [Microcoleus sp. FACHB-672]|uniref:hypothetical protein n=1 Tax=Microcoleus sp. FACHB-672 TaxID=2692825 RepID=UPI001681CC31|nr:hypothetical protein [Microcoleus sp. FACHB-672]MBD2039467.1 hypothetical protein [Microcoleus sp. FACHB-672]